MKYTKELNRLQKCQVFDSKEVFKVRMFSAL